MCAAIALWNIVRVAKHVLLVTVVPLQRCLNANTALHHGKVKHRWVNRRLVAIQVFNERLDAALVFKNFFALIALVDQTNAHAGIQKRQLAQSPRKNVVVKLYVRKGSGAWLESQRRSHASRVAHDR